MDAPTVESWGTLAGVTAVVIVVTAIVKQVWQPTDAQSTRFMPLVSIVTGIVTSLLGTLALNLIAGTDLLQAAIVGLFAGFSASGLYDTIRGGAKVVKDQA